MGRLFPSSDPSPRLRHTRRRSPVLIHATRRPCLGGSSSRRRMELAGPASATAAVVAHGSPAPVSNSPTPGLPQHRCAVRGGGDRGG
ncbi:hypothetical protein BRADI_1g05885v3 [Brachypodium distachyon]|uniref:Uncharacterized protein n=1 Tax=Brachypodium distachyon TaxID=15368 RepID=A0A0Q3N7Y5_BRADI|nr:hypothetical protein BRADI_1g05885v3 [Brachypodium distachyon]